MGLTLILILSILPNILLAFPWWNSASIYQVYPLSLKDSDGDGYGDLAGLTSALEYFPTLGVDALWITPIFASPMADFGYDISDYRAINPIFGTMEDFDSFMEEAKREELRILLDFVPNHSSDQHMWFQKSEARVEKYADYYVWSDPAPGGGPPNNWLSKVRSSAWSWSEKRQQYYYHQYQAGQPDLNYRNPAVVDEMKAVLDFWLEKGIDGVRMDAVSHLVEDLQLRDEPVSGETDDHLDWRYLEHIYTNNQPETKVILKELTSFIKEKFGEKFVLLETDLDAAENMEYYQCGDMPFNFGLARHLQPGFGPEQIREEVLSWVSGMPAGSESNWVTGSHDMGRVGSRLGEQLIDHMNMLALMLPGLVVTYQGEELGMRDTDISWEETRDPAGCACGPTRYQECSRDPERTPFQWSNEKNAGFSNGSSTWLPVNPNYLWLNLADQDAEGHNSHLSVYKDIQAFRNTSARGKADIFTEGNLFVLSTSSSSSSSPEWILLLNLGPDSVSYHGRQDEIGHVVARSVGGSPGNSFGTILDLSEINLQAWEALIVSSY